MNAEGFHCVTHRGQTQARRWRRAWLLVSVPVSVITFLGPAHAQTGDVAVQAAEVALVDGTGTVDVANLTDDLLTLVSATVPEGCTLLDPPSVPLPAGERTEVTLSTSEGCDLDDVTTVELAFASPSGGAVSPATTTVVVEPASSPSPEWSWISWSYLAAGLVALTCVGVVRLRLAQFNATHGAGWWYERRRSAYDAADPDRRTHKWWKTGLFEGHTCWDPCSAACPHTGTAVGWDTDLPGLGTGWSFKDTWAANATLASSLLVALLAGSDLLNDLLGEAAKAAVTLLAVSGALAALLVGVGPLLLKAIGRKVERPTVLGVLAAAGLATAGTLGQIIIATRLAAETIEPDVPAGVAIFGGAAMALLMITYAVRAIEFNLVSGLDEPAETHSLEQTLRESISTLAAKVAEVPPAVLTLASARRQAVPPTVAEAAPEHLFELDAPSADDISDDIAARLAAAVDGAPSRRRGGLI